MADRLDAVDAAFLHVEQSGRPQHAGTLFVCHDPEGRVDYAALVARVRRHLPAVPRYRQVVRSVPGHLAPPVWVDDAAFDIAYHVRRSALPQRGGDEQLYELVARIMSRPLDRSRPLWELYLVEGLSGARVGILSKNHHVLVDGVATVDLGQLMLDSGPDDFPVATGADGWRATAAPSSLGLVGGAILDTARRPGQVARALQTGLTDSRTTVRRVAKAATSVASAARSAVLPAPSPLRSRTGAQRLFSTVDTSLADYRLVRARHGGSINDVVLATVTGALRTWLDSRGAPVATGATVRAVIPVSVTDAMTDASAADSSPASQVGAVSTYLVDLPVGEQSPVMRLHQVGYATTAHKDTGRSVGADALVRLTGFAPPTLHALGARVASTLSQRASHLVIANVPGPQSPRYVAGARLLRSYPVTPLPSGQALSIGVTSYDGGVYFGLYADRDTMPDVEVMAQCLVDALRELVEAR